MPASRSHRMDKTASASIRMDAERVGIFEPRQGGQESTTAVLLHPSFTKLPTPSQDVTTTGWIKSGGTNNGWATHWQRSTKNALTLTTPFASTPVNARGR